MFVWFPVLSRVKTSCCPLVAVGLLATSAWAAPPVVPGYEWLLRHTNASPFALGEVLLGELNCLSCHEAEPAFLERLPTKQAPDLSQVGRRLTPQYLRRYLTDPQSVKPGATMPNVFHRSAVQSRDGAVDYLVHFLVAHGGPIAPSKSGGDAHLVRIGRELFHRVGCVACHAPENAEGITTPVVPLPNLALKTTVDQLAEFLRDPLGVRPSGHMPNLRLSEEEANAIAVYLLREQLANPQSAQAAPPVTHGLAFEYYEVGVHRLPDFDKLTAKARGHVPRITLDLPIAMRKTDFAVRFRGLITISKEGEYTFATASDDGSRLFIDGTLVVDNDGEHGTTTRSGRIHLTPGDHTIEVTFFERGGPYHLKVYWTGPGLPEQMQEIPSAVLWRSGGQPMVPLESEPFQLDRTKVRFGMQMFAALRCAACHKLGRLRPMTLDPPLEALDPEAPHGCLSRDIRKGLPDYQLSEAQRDALKAALRDKKRLRQPLAPAEVVRRTLATLNCLACHERDGLGGPDSKRAEFFQTLFPIDLGEEGTLPPNLNGIGGKLKPAALRGLLEEGRFFVRHYMATRMPDFGAANLRAFQKAVVAVDARPGLTNEPPFTAEAAKVGRRLVGATGMACITCHRIAGQKALAIQGIDLATVYDRLTPGWFHQYLLNPSAFYKNTRMPQFWPDATTPFPDLLGGDAHKQIDAIWSYLSLKNSLPLPDGIMPEEPSTTEPSPVSKPNVP